MGDYDLLAVWKPGRRFRLSSDPDFRARMNQDGWFGAETGAVEEIVGRHFKARLDDEQPWVFTPRQVELYLRAL